MSKVLTHCARERRIKRTRRKIMGLAVHRVVVHRTPRHIYAQLLEAETSVVLACASSLEKPMRESKSSLDGKKAMARKIGELLGERALKAGVKKIAFDRSGYRYHGRVASLAEGLREAGINF